MNGIEAKRRIRTITGDAIRNEGPSAKLNRRKTIEATSSSPQITSAVVVRPGALVATEQTTISSASPTEVSNQWVSRFPNSAKNARPTNSEATTISSAEA